MVTEKLQGARQNVALDREQYAQLKAYSNLTGIPVSVIVRRAMAEYIEVTIGAKLQAIAEKAHSDATAHAVGQVITMPSPAYTAADAMSVAPTLDALPEVGTHAVLDEPSWVTNPEHSN
jgi:hypothetical protein